SVFALPSRFRTTKPSRIVSKARSAFSSAAVIGIVRLVRPFGVVGSPYQVCWFTVIVFAIRSTSSRQRSALTSPLRSPASPARHTAAHQSGPDQDAAQVRGDEQVADVEPEQEAVEQRLELLPSGSS